MRGSLAYVVTLRSYFEYEPTNALVADAITIVNATGGGQWLRTPVSNLSWSYQANWTIDSGAGKDENSGTLAAPIRTNAELWRRLGYGAEALLSQVTAFKFIGNFPASDPLILSLRLTGAGVYTSFTGTVTVLARPTLPTMTGQPGIAAFVGQRVTITSGAATGASFWLERVIAGDQIETTNPLAAMPIPNSGVPTPTTITAGVGNNYQTETVSRIDAMNVSIKVADLTSGPPNLNSAYFIDLDLQKSVGGGSGPIVTSNVQIVLQGCGTGNLFSTTQDPAVMIYDNCSIRASNVDRGTHFFFGGMSLGASSLLTFQETAWALFDQDFVCQSTRIRSRRRGQVNVGTLCIQNCGSGSGFTVESDAVDSKNATNFAGAHLLYGTGNADVGLVVGSGRAFFYVSTKPTVTGVGGDTKIGSAAVTAYAAIPFVFSGASPNNNAQVNIAFP